MSTADYLHSRRYLEDEIEILGRRLDTARDRLKNSRGKWARRYWCQVLDSLIIQWRNSTAVNLGQNLGPGTARWQVRYDFFEPDTGINQYDFSRRIFDRIFRTDLNDSWERERMRKLTGGR
jgi:hypothetical protein